MVNSARQLHMKISDTLEQRIRVGYYGEEEQFPTELQLTEEFGVSRGTVRKALQILENQGVLSRVAGKGTFINSPEALIAKTEATSLVGIAIPHRNDQLCQNIMAGAERVLRERGYGLIYTNLENHVETEREQVQRLKAQRVAGIILFPLSVPGEAEILCSLIGSTPVVLVDRELPEFCGSVVMADHYQGAYEAVNYLLALGHRQITMVSHPSTSSSVLARVRGYEQAMRDAGLLPYVPVPLFDSGRHPLGLIPDYAAEEMRLVDHMLSVTAGPTAVFCVNDHIATGVMRLALAKGRRVPEDLAIIGFDNSHFAQLTPVPLTSMEQSGVEIGTKAAEILLRKISNPLEKEQKVLIPTRLVERASTLKGAAS